MEPQTEEAGQSGLDEVARVTLGCTRSQLTRRSGKDSEATPCSGQSPDMHCGVGHARCRRSFWRPHWPAAVIPTHGSTPCPRKAGPRSTATRPTAATRRASGATNLTLRWTRSVKGSLAAAPALSSRNWMALNAQTPGGCSLMEWENDDNGRQRWCTRLFQGGGISGPLFDGFDNLYVGQPGAIVSFPPTQWIRWRRPVIGMPSTPRFLGHSQLLVVTHLGQVQVFDAHRGIVVGNSMDLVDGVDPADFTRGLADCGPARAGCPVAAAPAFAAASGMVVVGLWQPGAPAAGADRVEVSPGAKPAAHP